jgi:hypothetical protein
VRSLNVGVQPAGELLNRFAQRPMLWLGVAMLASLGLLVSGCGGSSGSDVAQLGSTTTATKSTTGPGASPTSGGPTTSQSSTSQMLAYARCMRSLGVPTFPDPNSSGQIPKAQVVSARQNDPSRFDSAGSACRHLLPGGGHGETPAQIAADWTQFRQFTNCMRSHGVHDFPDPTNRSTTDRRPNFNFAAVGLDPNSPQRKATAQQCASMLHMGRLPPAG